MDDVVQRLRDGLEAGAIDLADIMDAADEIERLRRLAPDSRDRLRAQWDRMHAEAGAAVSDNCVAGNQPEMSCLVTEPLPKEKRAGVSDTNHDAAPAAKARTDADRNRTDKAAIRPGEGTGDSLSKAEIDALQHVVEDGRIVKMQDYGCLRALLVRLRPEWEDDDQQPERTHVVRHTQSACAKQAEGSVPTSRTENKPVAWGVGRVGGGWVSILGNAVQAETSRQSFDKMENWVHEVVALYRQPQPTLTDAEREALSWFTGGRGPVCPQHLSTIRGLISRLA